MKGKEKSPIPLYSARPPPWLPPAHSSARLGHPGYYPPRLNQEEDVLSVGNVKNGFSLPLAVPSENSTLQQIASECLNDSDTIGKLEELINQVFLRRSQHLPSIPTSSFRIPSRVTLNDTKRQAWFADLADPKVPLNKLGKSVPHGAKGHDLLDLLQSNNVAIPRAVWFLRVFGANETAGLRNKPSYNPTQYSVEWAGVVTSYMKKQLAEIALPSAPRPGMNIKQTFKGVLADPATRERWIQRFSYCLALLQSFYWEGMVDHRTLLVWVVHQMGTCNLAQAGFIARIADEYLEGMMLSRPLASHFVSACVSKLAEISSSPSKDFLTDTESILKEIVKRLCLALPDAFVSPKLWQEHAILLDIILREDLSGVDSQSANRIRYALARHCDDIQRRNEAMLFVHMPPLVTARLGSSVRDIKILISISKKTNINSVSFFSDDLEDTKHKLDLLLTWCVTPLQFGDHRPFAAVTLIYNWRQRASTRALRRECRAPDEFLQDQLFTWLDTSEVAVDRKVLHTVSLVFGKLVQRQLFSYERYIQRLVARSEAGLCVNDLQESRHRNFLRWISLTESSHISQRKIALYGIRVRQVPEDANEKEMRRELRTILPIFNGASTDVLRSPEALFQKCPFFLKAPRYEQVRTLKSWLLPILQDHITRTESVDDVVLKSYCLAVELAAKTKCFSTMLKLTLAFLEHSATPEALNTAIDTVRRFVTIWTCMDAINPILQSLETAHLAWKGRGVQSRPLLFVMDELDQGRYLTPQAREQLQTDRSIYSLALQPLLVNPPVEVPNVLPEILVLVAGNADPQAPSTLANTLWVKYRMSYDWAWKVWDNTIASLRQIPVMIADEDGRRECALRYAHFLCHIDQHLPSGIDDEVLRWLKGPGKNEVALLSAESWDIVTVLLLFMVIQGALKTTTIMTGLVYPAWKLGASASTMQQAGQIELFLTAANSLVKALLLCEEGTSIMTPPSDIFDIQRLQTRKEDVYCDSHFPELVNNIPIIVSLENNDVIPERLRAEVKAIRHSLYEDEDFRRGTFHNLDALRDAFEHAMNLPENTSPEVGERIVAALRMIFSETPDEDIEIYSWPEKSSLLSPWMISATTIQLRFFWKQMERSFETHANETAIVKLDKFTSVIFDHSLSSDEASFVTQMTHGVGSAVAGRIINNGLRYITAALQKDDPSCVFQTGESFRMLIYIAEPLRKNSQLPALQADVQDDIFLVLCRRFSLMDVQCRESSGPCPQETLTQKVILLARLLQFDLGFEGAWTPNTIAQSRELCQTLYRLALFHATGPNYNPVVFSLLFDTLLFLVDETPIQNKLASFDPFAAYPTIDPDQLDSSIPPEHLKQLRSLLPSLPSISTVSDLGTFRRDSSGNLVPEGPVVNRPWEWTENLGDPSILDPKEAEREKEEKKRLHVKYLVKNAGSLSLETFGARMTGDGILESKTDDLVIEGNLRAFEDGLSAESIFKRDWRETRLEVDGGSMMISQQGKLVPSNMEASSSAQGTRVQSRASPTSSVHSRSSARASGRRGSSSVNRSTASNASEIIDVDMLPTVSSSSKRTASGSKRKAATVSDDEVVIVEGPVASTSRAKKPRTASKSVASKTKPRKK